MFLKNTLIGLLGGVTRADYNQQENLASYFRDQVISLREELDARVVDTAEARVPLVYGSLTSLDGIDVRPMEDKPSDDDARYVEKPDAEGKRIAWIDIARLAGENNVRYATNHGLVAFIQGLVDNALVIDPATQVIVSAEQYAEYCRFLEVEGEALTFDQRQERFQQEPNFQTAFAYLKVAAEYHADDMIGEDTWTEVKRAVSEFLSPSESKLESILYQMTLAVDEMEDLSEHLLNMSKKAKQGKNKEVLYDAHKIIDLLLLTR